MLKHWLEAQIQHNRNYESCLVHSCFVLQNPKSDLLLFQTGTHPQNSVSFLMATEMGKSPPDIRCNPNLYLVNEAQIMNKISGNGRLV